MSKIKLSNEDRKALVDLYKAAERAPVVVYQTSPVVKTLSGDAWAAVRKKMDELAEKYGFKGQTIKSVNKKTGQIIVYR